MSWFPHSPYAEDQPLSHEILYFHTIRAGAMMGSVIAALTAPAMLTIQHYRQSVPINASTFIPRLLTHSSRGIVIGSIFGAAATFGRMRGKEEIEWQDRAWRLNENKAQVALDKYALAGVVLGSSAGILGLRQGKLPVGMGKAALGGGGVGLAAAVCSGMLMRALFAKGGKPE